MPKISLPLRQVGVEGASQFDPRACLQAIATTEAESMIVLPQMLQALVTADTPQDPRIRSLKFVAVGGAKTPDALIIQAREYGFPVYEGYGLSECSSVVTLNIPGQDRVGSTGRALPNRTIRIAQDGKILIQGHGICQYLGQPASTQAWWASGDIGYLDAAGFLHTHGHKRNILITGYGRNISPEWPEAVLLGSGCFSQVMAEIQDIYQKQLDALYSDLREPRE